MGTIQNIKETYFTLSIAERKHLIQELIDEIDNNVPGTSPPLHKEQFVITSELKQKHPLLKLAGMWSEQEGENIARTIRKGDWIDDGSYD